MKLKLVRRAFQMFEDYKELRTLQLVADKHGMTRERVRQILEKGTSEGLFKYIPFARRTQTKYPKEEFIKFFADNREEEMDLRLHQKSYLARLYNVSIIGCRMMRRRAEALQSYVILCMKQGKILNSTYIQAKQLTLRGRIDRYWGSFGDFRREALEEGLKDERFSKFIWDLNNGQGGPA